MNSFIEIGLVFKILQRHDVVVFVAFLHNSLLFYRSHSYHSTNGVG